jgi:hypothetical protein
MRAVKAAVEEMEMARTSCNIGGQWGIQSGAAGGIQSSAGHARRPLGPRPAETGACLERATGGGYRAGYQRGVRPVCILFLFKLTPFCQRDPGDEFRAGFFFFIRETAYIVLRLNFWFWHTVERRVLRWGR